MSLRAAVVILIVLATAGFAVGTALEHNSGESASAHAGETTAPAEGGGESAAAHAAEGAVGPAADTHAELRPLGVNVETPAFIVVAALGSLAIALGIWVRAGSLAVAGVAALVMAVFAALDVDELVHQLDEHRTGLAVLATAVAALHAGAALGASACGRRARRRTTSTRAA